MSLDFTALMGTGPAAPDTAQRRGPDVSTWSGAIRQLENKERELESTRQDLREQRQHIKSAGTLQSDILKSIKAGEDPLDILLKALECISLLTGESVTYTQGKEDIIAIYGWGLKEPAPLRVDLEEARQRLAMLTRPDLITRNTTEDSRRRIQSAIEAHQRLIATLERDIAEAGQERQTS